MISWACRFATIIDMIAIITIIYNISRIFMSSF